MPPRPRRRATPRLRTPVGTSPSPPRRSPRYSGARRARAGCVRSRTAEDQGPAPMDLGATGFLPVDQQLDRSTMAAIDVHGHRVPPGVQVKMATPPHHKSPEGSAASNQSMPYPLVPAPAEGRARWSQPAPAASPLSCCRPAQRNAADSRIRARAVRVGRGEGDRRARGPALAVVSVRRDGGGVAGSRPAGPPHRARHRLQGGRRLERPMGEPRSDLRRRRLPRPRYDSRHRIHHGMAAGEEPVGGQPLRLRRDLRLLQGAPRLPAPGPVLRRDRRPRLPRDLPVPRCRRRQPLHHGPVSRSSSWATTPPPSLRPSAAPWPQLPP